MATGPTNSSSSKTKQFYTQKRIFQQKRKRFDGDTVASDDDSSSQSHRPYGNSNNSISIPGYVKIDDKVRISTNSGSKSVVRELKRKLVSELNQIRSLRKKLEAVEFNGQYNKINNRNGGTLARVNSEVSCVGPTSNLVQLQGLIDNSYNNDNDNHFDMNLDEERKISKVDHKRENILNSDNTKKKKVKPGKVVNKGVTGNAMGRCNNGEVFNKCKDLLEMLMKHKYGWVFNEPVDVKKLKLHDYFKIIKHPMDLGTVQSRLKKNWYKSPKEFAEDVRLTFNNAITYNEKGQDVHIMANLLLKFFEEKWADIGAKFDYVAQCDVGSDASLHAPSSKRGSAPPAPDPASNSPPLQKIPSKSRIEGRLESVTNSTDCSLKPANIGTHEGRKPMSKKLMEMDSPRREMTFEDKQRLRTDLLNLPSEKLDTVVQIIKKKNPGLCQQDDEIEVDIDSFDFETLWELDRLVISHKNSLNKDKRIAKPAFQARGETGHNIKEANLTSSAAVSPEESEAGVEKFDATSLVQREKHGDHVSRSSSSASSSSDSVSSLSDSESESSSGFGSGGGQ